MTTVRHLHAFNDFPSNYAGFEKETGPDLLKRFVSRIKLSLDQSPAWLSEFFGNT